ncbi:arsenical-resistance membrane protein [Thecamonas trahens ATCC 50062]|uniref:Arsenical-resistance membrane protein n=1 Tax=Thecamonas trahens ATCC 50062 TaxID=461836 RepID=A0A0L0DPN9_THETB|nr:arsenical-resistance membrane protein [Thecamonas trahens ATCC 50062]KNC54220.1 arsenical-resistance membrane protein [Thecamonas trahens ATCC 50062]|eukprot:XP_013753859.1 arsenical-resistance membrane protein [Thecamonas trahens ATCC 50062]
MGTETSTTSIGKKSALGCFGTYLPLWVVACMVVGATIGSLWPEVAERLDEATVEQVSLPVAVLIWIMVVPMALTVDFDAILGVFRFPRGLLVTTAVNWLVQPFLMYGLATLFFRPSTRAVILGGSPCTAMVFTWSVLARGDGAYTLVQVALNDALIFVLYAPTMFLLLSASDIHVPYITVVIAVLVFVAVPFAFGFVVQKFTPWADSLARILKPFTIVALLATLLIIFVFQGERLTDRWTDVLLIAVPLTLQTYLVFAIAAVLAWYARLPFNVAAPATFISASNFFELGVAVAIASYGLDSGAVLVNVVGVLVEVPIMLSLVWSMKKAHSIFDARAGPASDHDSDISSEASPKDYGYSEDTIYDASASSGGASSS